MEELLEIGKIKKELFRRKYNNIKTDKVIITQERIHHIQVRHPDDYELFIKYRKECVECPDIIINDDKNTETVFMIKKLSDMNLNIVIRLSLKNEENLLNHSVMTCWRIRNKNLKKMMRKNQILYKKE